ncbi:MAG: zinc ABC transporter solute-binding protein [Gammaproteobacteria bacterium]|nr:zinc ABC transporter solute-binding protein [Gammaproteobacteria bacterium]
MLLFIMHSMAHAASTDNTRSSNRSGPIVVTVKPLYSLVAQLTAGIETPVLLMKQMQSPHHYTMKPSQRRLLANARIIIWLGPQLESYLTKIIQQQSTETVTALQAKNLKLLKLRHKASHQHNSGRIKADETHMIDPHVWLSTENTAAISRQITDALIKNNPENTAIYQRNLETLLQKIVQTHRFIKTTLQGKQQPFIAFHDAFQYFEAENGLNYIDSISFDDETSSSLRHIREISASIDKHNIRCLVYQPPKPALIDTLTKRTNIKATALDPLGLNLSDNKNAWFDIMRQLALNFEHCLGH